LDLFIANSHPDDSIDKIKSDVTYSEPLLLFHNTGKGLEDVSLQSGPNLYKEFFGARLSDRGLQQKRRKNDGCRNQSNVTEKA
jgi:hypothetical protein